TTAPTLGIAPATATGDGYLSHGDWSTFNGKQDALGYTPVNKAGDTMTGALNLPTDGLAVGTGELVVTSGKVGLGTSSPAVELHIAGTSTARLRLETTTGQDGV